MNKLPKGWATATLGDICIQPAHRAPAADETFTYIDIASIDRDLKVVSEPQHLLGAGAPSRARKVIEKGDVIVSMTRPNLNAVALISERYHHCIASTGFDVLRPILVEPRWIFAVVRSADFINAMCEKVQGALYPAIRSKDIREYKIPLPPLSEQIHIANKLDSLFLQINSISSRFDAILAQLKKFRQSALEAAVSGKLTEDSEDSKPSSDWQIVPFSTVIKDLRYGTAQKCDYNGGATGVLRIPNISENGINIEDLKSSNFSEVEIRKLALQEGDILLIRSNGSISLVGKSAIASKNEEGLLFAGYLIRARLDKEKALPAYVNYWLKSPSTRKAIELTARSTNGVNNINSEEIKSLNLALPPIKAQAEIAHRLEQLFSFADQLEDSISNAQARIGSLTQSILFRALSGELSADWRIANPSLISDENSGSNLINMIQTERDTKVRNSKPQGMSPRKADNIMSKKIISITEALNRTGTPLSGQQLLAAAGYPPNSNTDLLEQFFLDVREALTQKKIIKQSRDHDGQDWFALTNTR